MWAEQAFVKNVHRRSFFLSPHSPRRSFRCAPLSERLEQATFGIAIHFGITFLTRYPSFYWCHPRLVAGKVFSRSTQRHTCLSRRGGHPRF